MSEAFILNYAEETHPHLIITGIYLFRDSGNHFHLPAAGNARVINYAGVVRGATQRLIKQELLA